MEEIKLGFVSRTHTQNCFRHVVLMTQRYDTKSMANLLGIRWSELWGSLKEIIDRCMALEEGEYLLWRDPNNPVVKIYSVPEGAFENDGRVFFSFLLRCSGLPLHILLFVWCVSFAFFSVYSRILYLLMCQVKKKRMIMMKTTKKACEGRQAR